MTETITLYRGVGPNAIGSNTFNNALNGIAKPLWLWSFLPASIHSLGFNYSRYTSWTTSRSIASFFAGKNGVVLKVTLSKNLAKKSWATLLRKNEQEWLLCGIVKTDLL